MQMNKTTAAIGVSLLATADLQDDLLTATNDLERLLTLVEEAPLRPNPATQSAMDTGFIELFQSRATSTREFKGRRRDICTRSLPWTIQPPCDRC